MSNIPFSANSILILKLNEFKNLPLGPLKKLSLGFTKGSTRVDGELRHKCFKGSWFPEFNSAGYLIVHPFQYINSCGGPIRKLTFLEVRPSLC